MMTTRTFKQFGQAYGSTPAIITATIDGSVVFSGEIPTTDAPLPILPDESITGTELFTWTNTVDFSGTQSFSISTTNSPLLLCSTKADYKWPTWPIPEETAVNNSAMFASFASGNTADPFTNVAIDGVPMQKGPDSTNLTGQWYWTIPAGSTFTATMNVNAGVEPPAV